MLNIADITLTQIALWIINVTLPIIVFYLAYLLLTKSFNYIGFTTFEGILIVLISFLFSFPIFLFGYNISNITLFTYNGWVVGVNTGGAIIPVLISIYLIIRKKIPLKHLAIGLLIVTIVTFFVTSPEPTKGIISRFPYWILPALFAGISSIFLLKKDFVKGASLSYSTGTLGVLIGADFLHLPKLLGYSPTSLGTKASIGGAVLFDLIFITGIIAVLFYGSIMFKYRNTA
jgi:uncharacterized membrane protein